MFEALYVYMNINPIGRMNRDNSSAQGYQDTDDSRSVVCKAYAYHQCSGTCGLFAKFCAKL